MSSFHTSESCSSRVVGYLVAVFSVKDEDAPGAAAAACVVHGAMEPAVDWAKCPGLLRNGVPGRPSKPPNLQTVRCSSSSTVTLRPDCPCGRKYSLVTCASAARHSPNSQSRPRLHTSVSNVHARVSESSPHCHCGAPRLSHIKHWYQRRYSATKSETLILLSVSQILLCASDRSQPSRTALPRNAST